MRGNYIYVLFALLLTISCDKAVNDKIHGCKDEAAINFDSSADTDCNCCVYEQADVYFWSKSLSITSGCRVITIKVDKIQQTSISRFFGTEPPGCDPILNSEGFLRINIGSHNYAPSSSEGCQLDGGSF